MCGLTPRRRRQPRDGATHAEPVFPVKGEAATEGAPPAHHGGWGARATRRGSRRKARVATVYTNDPKRRREARSSHLCTLLRSQGHSQPKPTAQQCTQMPRNGAERPFPPICVHSCAPTTARVTGRGHWSHDVDGPMAPVMSGCSDLRPTPPERWRNHPPTRTHEASYRVCIMCHGQLTSDIDRLMWRKENGAKRKPDHMKQPAPMAPNGFKLPVRRVILADENCA